MGRNKKEIYDDNELTPSWTIKNILIVQNEGKRKVSRNIEHYSLQLIIAVGFKIMSELSNFVNGLGK